MTLFTLFIISFTTENCLINVTNLYLTSLVKPEQHPYNLTTLNTSHLKFLCWHYPLAKQMGHRQGTLLRKAKF